MNHETSPNSEIEVERTFLARELPRQYFIGEPTRMVDVYYPAEADHPRLRARQKGDTYVLTKKLPVDNDPSHHTEQNIAITAEEFAAITEGEVRRIEKIRVPIAYDGKKGELDVFTGKHEGLLLVDFEFDSLQARDEFAVPEFCSTEVTVEDAIAGGILSGLSADELFGILRDKYGYEPVAVSEFEAQT